MTKDHFSTGSDAYRQSRPAYSASVFDALAQLAPSTQLLWDCGCGSGQASVPAAASFQRVIATDLSFQQVANADRDCRISYVVALAEVPPLPDSSVDAVVVAQAFHWFDQAAFFDACSRVLRPGGLLLVMSYNLLSVIPEIDRIIRAFYFNTLAGYWDDERRQVENTYADVQFPFESVDFPNFSLECNWALEQLLAYLNTWSAVKVFQKKNGVNPVDSLAAELVGVWQHERYTVRWPLSCIVRRKPC